MISNGCRASGQVRAREGKITGNDQSDTPVFDTTSRKLFKLSRKEKMRKLSDMRSFRPLPRDHNGIWTASIILLLEERRCRDHVCHIEKCCIHRVRVPYH